MKKAFSICFAKLKHTFQGSLRGQSSYSCHWTTKGTADAEHVHGMCLHQTADITVNLTSILFIGGAAL